MTWRTQGEVQHLEWTFPRKAALIYTCFLSTRVGRVLTGGGGLSNVGGAVGTALGIAAPCLAIILWFAVTYTYRLEKKLLVSTVLEHLQPSHVTLATADDLPETDFAKLTRQLEHVDSGTQMIAPEHRVSGTFWTACVPRPVGM